MSATGKRRVRRVTERERRDVTVLSDHSEEQGGGEGAIGARHADVCVQTVLLNKIWLRQYGSIRKQCNINLFFPVSQDSGILRFPFVSGNAQRYFYMKLARRHCVLSCF